jgi:MarR family transcriptional regulator for hemolysin
MDSLMKYIGRIHRCANTFRTNQLKDTGLSGGQHIYIFHICRHPGISQEELADLIYVNKSNVTRQLGSLEQQGFVRREPSLQDRRLQLVFPTDKAAEVYPRVRALMKRWNELITEDLTQEEQQMVISLMQKISEKAVAIHSGRGEYETK